MPVGNTMKLLVSWPPLEHNLTVLDDEPPGPERLVLIFDRDHGRRCAVVCRTTPLYLGSGCVHAVVTLRGRFMYAWEFMTADIGPAFVRNLRLSPGLIGLYEEPDLQGLIAHPLHQLATTLDRPICWHLMMIELVKSWPIIEGLCRVKDRKNLAQQLYRVLS